MIAGPEELKTDSVKKENSSAKQEKPEVKKESVSTEGVVKTIVKKKPKRLVTNAIAYIKATFNNTIINIVDQQGHSLCWSSGGAIGFKGSRKSTPFAAKRAAENVADKARKMGVREIAVKVKGPGSGRESAIRALQSAGLQIKTIEDITPLPHNGCRARKRRRV